MPSPQTVTHPMSIRTSWAVLPCALLIWGTVQAQDRIFRCGNEYTNNPAQSQRKDCVALDGGHITVIPAPRTNAAKAGGTQQAANASAVQSAADSSRISAAQQKARDSDARAILESELKKAETHLAQLQRDYNAGQPVRLPQETANPALYAERVATLKASLARAEADVVSIQRELQRAGGRTMAATSSSAALPSAPPPLPVPQAAVVR